MTITGTKFTVAQRFGIGANVYDVSDATGTRVAYVRQKLLAIRERLEIWTDDSKASVLCAVQARKVLELRSAYDVLDADGTQLALLQKVFGASLLRSTWRLSPVGEAPALVVTESSSSIAIVRRVQGLLEIIPFVGTLLAMLPIPYGFTWTNEATGETFATYRRVLGVRDRYELDIVGDPEEQVDRRAVIAMAICLDALQSR